jgi:tRNA_anti-like
MAIIPCRECAHRISDQAQSCPSCGAPVNGTVKIEPPRAKRKIVRVVVLLMTLWTVGTLLWLTVPRGASNELIARAKLSLQRVDGGIGRFLSTDQTKTTDRNAAVAQTRAAEASESRDGLASFEQPSSAQLPTADGQSVPTLRPVYRTTAQQLYEEYNANVVATRTKIGASRVRVTGIIATINQDVAGRPVVKLWTGKDSNAAMSLTGDQRAAAAQLAKDETVEVECDRIDQSGALLQGGDCSLTLVDDMSRQVNLALFVANDKGTTGVYVVGPMSEAACVAQGDSISAKLPVNSRGEYAVWRGCTDAAREAIPRGGCRLNSSLVSIPGVSAAHLSRYDCGSSRVARTRARKKTSASSPATTVAEVASPQATSSPAPTTALVGGGVALAPGAAEHADDLAPVRAVDAQAADHIAAHCSKTGGSTNHQTECRREEREAWTRLFVQNKFPTLDEKCSQPPFPDTYVAKEICARSGSQKN